MAEEKPYDDRPMQGWREEVESWGWTPVSARTWRTEGPCKRCGHTIHKEISQVYIAGVKEQEATAPQQLVSPDEPLPERVWMRCNCHVAHPSEAAGKGCGQHDRVRFAGNIRA
jgi:hypothetical protein